MRLLHTSDWHLGKNLHGYSLLAEQRELLWQILTIAKVEKVEAVLLCGDLYDNSLASEEAILLFNAWLDAFCELKIPLLMISGNHDSSVRVAYAKEQLEQSQIYIRGSWQTNIEPISLTDEHGTVAFYLLPFADKARLRQYLQDEAISSQADAYLKVNEQVAQHSAERRIALAHCFVAGGTASESERDITVGGLETIPVRAFSSFNYTALGHLHKRQILQAGKVVYSGSLFPYSFNETDNQPGVEIVDIKANGSVKSKRCVFELPKRLAIFVGEFSELMQLPISYDYVQVRLEDTKMLLNVRERLASIFPFLCSIERTIFNTEISKLGREKVKASIYDLFPQFYEEISGETWQEAWREYLERAAEESTI